MNHGEAWPSGGSDGRPDPRIQRGVVIARKVGRDKAMESALSLVLFMIQMQPVQHPAFT